MITWTTYGTWLQGDKRGYVKNGKILSENKNLWKRNKINQTKKAIRLTKSNRQTVREAILNEAEKLGQAIYSMAVCANHVHIVAECIDETIETVVARYKKAARQALNSNGFVGRVWTKGYDKRYCFDENSLKNKIDYVQRHD